MKKKCDYRNLLLSENYEQALSDFKECLKIQEAELEPDDRLLAETYPCDQIKI